MDCCCPRVALRFKALGGPRYALPWTALRQPSREEMRVILPPRQRTPPTTLTEARRFFNLLLPFFPNAWAATASPAFRNIAGRPYSARISLRGIRRPLRFCVRCTGILGPFTGILARPPRPCPKPVFRRGLRPRLFPHLPCLSPVPDATGRKPEAACLRLHVRREGKKRFALRRTHLHSSGTSPYSKVLLRQNAPRAKKLFCAAHPSKTPAEKGL